MAASVISTLYSTCSWLKSLLQQYFYPKNQFSDGKGLAYLAHLPLPFETDASDLDSIPYCCTKPYDCGTFLDYPNRAGWPQALPQLNKPSFTECENKNPSDDNELAAFLQAWLFFGLLHELLGSIYDESRYVRRGRNGATVHTTNLKHDVYMWSAKVACLTRVQSSEMFLSLRRCLLLANDALDVTIPSLHPRFDRTVRHSIALICDVIARVVEGSLPQPDGHKLPMSWGVICQDAEMVSTMRSHNWCHSDIAIAMRKGSASSLYIMERMKKPNLGRNHSICKQNECQYLTTDDTTYRTRHTRDDCNCEDISIDLDSLASALRQGAWPLLCVDLGDKVTVNVTVQPSTSSTPYVALSHVWADGLGNKKGNCLPACQLRRLGLLVQHLHRRLPHTMDGFEQRKLLFWCDTLCVPVENLENQEQVEVRKMAMESMRDVYQQSSYVLVLDRTFESYYISDIGLTEAAFRIITSPWAQRLWTLQEAVLPDNLLFQFADKQVDLREIEQYHHDLGSEYVLLNGIAMEIKAWCALIRQTFHAEAGQLLRATAVASLLHGRRVSSSADEALCLATLFGGDISRVLNVSKEERMDEFWRAMFNTPTGIPSVILFTEFPRSRTAGLRWAPSTLLVDSAIEQYIGITLTADDGRRGQLSEAGLLVEFPAFLVQKASCTIDATLASAPTEPGMLDTMRVRDTDGKWYDLEIQSFSGNINSRYPLELMTEREGSMVVLVRDQLGDGHNRYGQTAGLLANIEDNSSGIRSLRSLATVTVTPLNPSEQTLWSQAHVLAMQLRDSGYLDQVQPQTRLQSDSAAASSELAVHPKSLQDVMLKLVEMSSVMCAQNPALVQLIQKIGMRHPHNILAILARHILLGQYLIMPEKFEAGSKWCVD